MTRIGRRIPTAVVLATASVLAGSNPAGAATATSTSGGMSVPSNSSMAAGHDFSIPHFTGTLSNVTITASATASYVCDHQPGSNGTFAMPMGTTQQDVTGSAWTPSDKDDSQLTFQGRATAPDCGKDAVKISGVSYVADISADAPASGSMPAVSIRFHYDACTSTCKGGWSHIATVTPSANPQPEPAPSSGSDGSGSTGTGSDGTGTTSGDSGGTSSTDTGSSAGSGSTGTGSTGGSGTTGSDTSGSGDTTTGGPATGTTVRSPAVPVWVRGPGSGSHPATTVQASDPTPGLFGDQGRPTPSGTGTHVLGEKKVADKPDRPHGDSAVAPGVSAPAPSSGGASVTTVAEPGKATSTTSSTTAQVLPTLLLLFIGAAFLVFVRANRRTARRRG